MNNVYDTDVLIIGAGLAGSVLAYRLRQHGLRLADSLAGGEPYEDAMAPTVAEVTDMARSIELNYFMRCMQIIRSGTAHKGTPPK